MFHRLPEAPSASANPKSVLWTFWVGFTLLKERVMPDLRRLKKRLQHLLLLLVRVRVIHSTTLRIRNVIHILFDNHVVSPHAVRAGHFLYYFI